ncbi:MAG: hypothetical protein HYT38_01110 [Candidatus Sungbacteria bacterium]|uniref:Uncharacterized protein n=1 Tax=Candidatus Sungiibacteriota bacterium TaxID=2750080 RepID=A0A931YE37_9BACT|nr:hypothetical protein [Candidatus Sungbacteria bacterium]MBI2466164.1 hypothetical protein [Candidatus Sungbacteria bacterium]
MAESQTKKQVAAGAAGLFDPILRKLAQRLAETVSPDSPLRSEHIESAIGAIKGFAEVYAERFPILTSVAVEKATDFADFLAVFLAEDGHEVKTQNLLSKFLVEAAERLKTADDPQTEFGRISAELGFIKELARAAAQKPETKKDSAATALTESLGKLNQALVNIRDRIQKPKESSHVSSG